MGTRNRRQTMSWKPDPAYGVWYLSSEKDRLPVDFGNIEHRTRRAVIGDFI